MNPFWTAAIALAGALLANVGRPYLDAWMKRRENGKLIARNLALKQPDIVEQNIQRLSDDNDRLRDRVDQLEAERDATREFLEREHAASLDRGVEFRALLMAIEEDLNKVLAELTARHIDGPITERLLEAQERVRRGRSLGVVA